MFNKMVNQENSELLSDIMEQTDNNILIKKEEYES